MPGIDSYTKVMLHCEGDDQAYVFTDEITKTWTGSPSGYPNSPCTALADKKFGSTSLYFNGASTNRITTPYISDFDLSGDFTIDFWFNAEALPSAYQIKQLYCQVQAGGGANNFRMELQNTATQTFLQFQTYHNSVQQIWLLGTTPISTGGWHHAAVSRSGNNWYLFLDGSIEATQTLAADVPAFDYTPAIGSFRDTYNAAWYFPYQGYIDEFRLSNGIARWTSAFTPPSAAYDATSPTIDKTIEETIDFADWQDLYPYWEIIADGFSIAESVPLPIDPSSALDAVDFADFASGGFQYDKYIEEEIALYDWSDIAPFIFGVSNDAIDFTDITDYRSSQQLFINDSLFIFGTPQPGWRVAIADTITLIDAISSKTGITIIDWITMLEQVNSGLHGTDTISDMVVTTDNLVEALRTVLVSIADTLTTVDAVSFVHGLIIMEYLWLQEAIPLKDMASILDGIALSDETLRNWEGLIEDAIGIVDLSVLQFLSSIGEIKDAVGFADVSTDNIVLNFAALDSLTMADLIASHGNLFSVILDALEFGITVTLAGETWQCWVISNTEFDASVYSNFSFNSYCNFQNKPYGVKSDGLYSLEGTTDAGATVHAGVIFTTSNFGTENRKKFRRASLGVSGSNAAIRVETDEGADRIFKITDRRAYIDRDIVGKDFVFSIAEFDSLDFIDLVPVILSR